MGRCKGTVLCPFNPSHFDLDPTRKLAEWGDDDGFGPQPDPSDKPSPAAMNTRVVVLKHMFTLEDLAQDPTLLLDLKEDVREECAMLGEVTNVTLFDVSPVLS